jgi:hypothetical protein
MHRDASRRRALRGTVGRERCERAVAAYGLDDIARRRDREKVRRTAHDARARFVLRMQGGDQHRNGERRSHPPESSSF